MAHSFQPMSTDYFECNPFNSILSDWFAVTVKSGDKIDTMTAGWGGLGAMWGKHAAFIFLRESRMTKELLDSTDRLSLTFFEQTPRNKSTLKYIGKVSGHQEDKIAVGGISVDYYDDVPYLDDGNIVFICKKMYAGPIAREDFLDSEIDSKWYPDGDYHTMYVLEIEQMLAR